MIRVVKKAAEAVGSLSKLARELELTRQSLYNWERVPAERVIKIEELTGGVVSRFEMRPDIYPREDATPAKRPAKKPAKKAKATKKAR